MDSTKSSCIRGDSSVYLGSVLLMTLTLTSGCAGVAANFMHVVGGHRVPARFDGLTKQKVAVVCMSSSSSYGPTRVSDQIAKQVSKLLRENVADINVIQQQEIDRWKDENQWNGINYLEIGQGVGADFVVAIDLLTFRLHEGKTLRKGRCETVLSVYDVAGGGELAFQINPPQIQYPVNAGYPTTEISENDFRKRFVGVIAYRLARSFFPYDMNEDYAQDDTLVAH